MDFSFDEEQQAIGELAGQVLGDRSAPEQLRALRPSLRVLFTRGYADQRYRKRLPPNAEVLEKPFRVEALLSRIREILDG